MDEPIAAGLRGKLLLASPALEDPNFARSVVLVTEHGPEGAMGVVLNRPLELVVAEVAPALAEIPGSEGHHVYCGGPVQPEAVMIVAEFSDPSIAAWLVVADVGFVGAGAELEQVEPAVRRARVYAGYAGWGEGQLEAELEREDWIVEPPLPGELFCERPDDLWRSVLARKGGTYRLLATMPVDPSQN